jgi:Concanavalin A-like lectin/glucanases superfamily
MRAIALFALTGCTQIFGLSDPIKLTPAADAAAIDISLVDVASSDGSPAACGPIVTDLTACFDFEGAIVDGSPSGHVVTAVANVILDGNGPDGMFARVGLTSTITIAASTLFNTSAFTVAAWVYLDALPGPAARIGVFDSDGRYGMFIDAAGSMLVRGVTSPQGSIGIGTWTHLAVSDDGAAVVFYVNGVVTSSIATTSAVPTSNSGSEIGGNAPTGDRMVGRVDMLRVFRRVLQPSEVAAHVN